MSTFIIMVATFFGYCLGALLIAVYGKCKGYF